MVGLLIYTFTEQHCLHLECCSVVSGQCAVGGKSVFSADVNDSMRGLKVNQNCICSIISAAVHLINRLKGTTMLHNVERRRFRSQIPKTFGTVCKICKKNRIP